MIEIPSFSPFLTAHENLEYYRLQRGIPGKQAVDEVLELVRQMRHLSWRASAEISSKILPCSINPYRVATLASSDRMWLDMRMVVCRSRLRVRKICRNSATPSGSRPLMGSSRMRKGAVRQCNPAL